MNGGIEPVRGSVYTLTDFPKEPEEMTIREAVEWSKKIIRQGPNPLTGSETKFVTERWALLIKALADREGISFGHMSYLVHTITETEQSLIETALEEGRAASV